MTAETRDVGRYSFCESIHASGNSPWHIRRLSPAGRKLGGGIDTASLCDGVHAGWDLAVEITPHHLGHTCRRCVEVYRAENTAQEPANG